MVKQQRKAVRGDILLVDFNPTKGTEQQGWRPAVVVSGDRANQQTNMRVLCPITSTKRSFPLHVALDGRTKTQGEILCEQVRTCDLNARPYKLIEKLPEDILNQVLLVLQAIVEL